MNGEPEVRRHRAGLVPAAALLAVGLIGAAWVAGNAFRSFVDSRATLTVTGSAKKQVRADLAVWRAQYTAQATGIETAYAELKRSQGRVREYLRAHGIADSSMVFNQVQTMTLYQRMPNGMETGTVEGYRLLQQVEVRSADVNGIGELARSSTELLQQGVRFESFSPEYLLTRLPELKVEVLAAATRDARLRAQEMAKNAGSRIGRLRSARMGVFQVTPVYSTMVTDYGVNDTSSLDKDITAVVSVSFEIR
jgi:hypothetical protein